MKKMNKTGEQKLETLCAEKEHAGVGGGGVEEIR